MGCGWTGAFQIERREPHASGCGGLPLQTDHGEGGAATDGPLGEMRTVANDDGQRGVLPQGRVELPQVEALAAEVAGWTFDDGDSASVILRVVTLALRQFARTGTIPCP